MRNESDCKMKRGTETSSKGYRGSIVDEGLTGHYHRMLLFDKSDVGRSNPIALPATPG